MIDLAQLLGFDRDVKPYTEVNYKQDSSGSAKFVLTPIASSVLDSVGHFYIFCAILIFSVIASLFVNTSIIIIISSILLYAICLNAFRFGATPNFGNSDDERIWLIGWSIVALLITLGLWEIHTTQSGWINILQPIIVGVSILLIWFTNRRIYVAMKEDLTENNYNKSSFWMYITRLPFIGLLSYTYVYSVDTTLYWIGLLGFTSSIGVMYTILHIVGITDDKLEGADNESETESNEESNTKTSNKSNTKDKNDHTESNDVSKKENPNSNKNTVDSSSKILDNIDLEEDTEEDTNKEPENDNPDETTFNDEVFSKEDDENNNNNEKENNSNENEEIIGGNTEDINIPDDKIEELTENLRDSIKTLNNTLENKNIEEYKLTEIEETPPTENTINWLSTESEKLTNYLIDNQMDEGIRKQLIDVQQNIEEIKEYIHRY